MCYFDTTVHPNTILRTLVACIIIVVFCFCEKYPVFKENHQSHGFKWNFRFCLILRVIEYDAVDTCIAVLLAVMVKSKYE